MLYVFDELDNIVLESKVVIGRDSRPTPNFNDYISHIVVSPTWNVPKSLERRDVLPKLRNNPALIDVLNYRILDTSGRIVTASFKQNGLKMQDGWRIQQAPGPNNSLGSVKFMVKGHLEHGPAIYLHDTNHPELFDRETRRYSSGCIRIEKARELASIMGVHVGKYRANERWVKLPVPIRVTVVGN